MFAIDNRGSRMGTADRNVNFRASEQTHKELDDIQRLFHPFLPDRSTTLRWIIRKFWEVLFTDTNLTDILKQWQVMHGKTSQHKQLQLVFGEPLPAMFPRIWPSNRTPTVEEEMA